MKTYDTEKFKKNSTLTESQLDVSHHLHIDYR